MRNLLLLAQDAIERTEELPVSEKAVRRAITQARDIYRLIYLNLTPQR